MVAKCWRASTSVGAISAVWLPIPTARVMARNATTVLPLPTSPWSNRSMRTGAAMSVVISSSAWVWAPVRVNGSAASAVALRRPSPSIRRPGRRR